MLIYDGKYMSEKTDNDYFAKTDAQTMIFKSMCLLTNELTYMRLGITNLQDLYTVADQYGKNV